MLPQVVLNSLMLAVTFGMLAVGLSVTYSIMGVLNFALGAISMLGAYFVFYAVASTIHTNYLVALVMAFVAAGLLGLLMQRGFLWKLHNQLLACMIITMAAANLIQGAVSLATPGAFLTLPSFIHGIASAGGIIISWDRLLIIVIGGSLILGTYLLINRSKLGRTMRATAYDEEMASLQGVRVASIHSFGMFLSSGLAGVVGGLAALTTPLTPTMGEGPLINAFIIVILGGFGSITGSILASAIMGIVISFTTTYFGAIHASAATFGVLILILLVRPRGLLGGASKAHD